MSFTHCTSSGVASLSCLALSTASRTAIRLGGHLLFSLCLLAFEASRRSSFTFLRFDFASALSYLLELVLVDQIFSVNSLEIGSFFLYQHGLVVARLVL